MATTLRWIKKERKAKPPKPPKTKDWQRMVTENLAMAQRCVTIVCGRLRNSAENDYWLSEATYVLVKVARGYDPTHISPKTGCPVKFSSYAFRSIIGHLERERGRETHRNHQERRWSLKFDRDRNMYESGAAEDGIVTGTLFGRPDDRQRQVEVRDELRSLLRRCRLSFRQYRILILFFFRQWPADKVAAQFGVSGRMAQQWKYEILGKIQTTAGVPITWAAAVRKRGGQSL